MRIAFVMPAVMLLASLLVGCQSANDAYVARARPGARQLDRMGPFTRDKDVCKAFDRPAFSARSDILASRQSGDCAGR